MMHTILITWLGSYETNFSDHVVRKSYTNFGGHVVKAEQAMRSFSNCG